MVFLGPVDAGIHDVAPHHRPFRCKVIAAARTVGEGSVRPASQPVAGNDTFHPIIGMVGVVVHNVHDHAHPRAVNCRNHGAAFPHADLAVVGVGGVAAFRNVIIQRIIAPVVAAGALINRGKLKNWLELHMGHAEVFEVVQAGRVNAVPIKRCIIQRKGEELTAQIFRHTAVRVGRKIRDVRLPDRLCVGRQIGAAVLLPAIGHSRIKVQHHAAQAINASRARIRVGGAVGMAVREGQFIAVILPRKVAGQYGQPGSMSIFLHGGHSQIRRAGFLVRACRVAVQRDRTGGGCPDPESRAFRGPVCAKVMPQVSRQCRCLCFIHR